MASRNLKIPERHLSGFKFLAKMPYSKQEKLLKQLRESKATSSIQELIAPIADTLKFDIEKLDRIIYAIVSLIFTLMNESESEQKAFIDNVLEALNTEFKRDNFDWDSLRKTFSALLDLEDSVIGLIARAIHSSNNRALLVRDTEIVSDVRPIFYTNSAKKPTMSIILHSLKMGYMENDTEKTLYFTMDYKDINNLISQLERAKVRQEKLE